MATRILTGLIRGPDGEPLDAFPLRFTVSPSQYTAVAHYPYRSVDVATEPDGTFAIELVTNIEYRLDLIGAFKQAGSTTAYPKDSRDIKIVVPDGDGPVALETLRGTEGINPDVPDVQSMIQQVVIDYLAEHGSGTVAWGNVIGDIANQPDLQAAMADKADIASLADIATSGDYADLANAPVLFDGDYGSLANVPATFAPAPHNHDAAYLKLADAGSAALADTGDFATAAQGTLADTALQPGDVHAVATSGNYADLNNKPTVPAQFNPIAGANISITGTYPDMTFAASGGGPSSTVDSVNGETGHVVLDADDIDDTSTSHKFVAAADLAKLSNLSGTNTGDQNLSPYALTSSLAGVALSGAYAELTGKPTLGTAAAMASTAFATAAQGGKADSAVQPAGIANFETTTQLNTRDTANRSRANHTGTQAIATLATTGTASATTYLRGDGLWTTPTNTTYVEITDAEITTGTATTARAISGRRAQFIVDKARTGVALASSLALVATSGAYADLSGKPTLFDGSYSSLSGAPTLGTAASQNSTAFATAAQGTKADTAVQPAGLTKAAVGLGNVDNTSDASKPISTATATALSGKAATSHTHTTDGSIAFSLHGGGEAIAVGAEATIRMNFAGTFTGWDVYADQPGSIVTTVGKATHAAYPTFTAISGSAKPTLASTNKNQTTTLTGWTTAFAAGDVLRVVVDSAATVETVSISLRYTRTV